MRLNIPPVPSDLFLPVRALVRAAYLFRGVLVEGMRDGSLGDVGGRGRSGEGRWRR